MNETFWIVAEIIVGIGILGLLSAVITAIMVPLLSKTNGPADLLAQRYAKGDLTRDEYLLARRDLGLDLPPLDGQRANETAATGRMR